jgi:hypothetical protein
MESLWFYIMIIAGICFFLISIWNVFILRKQRRYEKYGDLGERIESFVASRSSKIGVSSVQVVFFILLYVLVNRMNRTRDALEKVSDRDIIILLEDTVKMDIAMIVLLSGMIFLYGTKVIRTWKTVSIYEKGIISRGILHSFHQIGEVTGDEYSAHLHLPEARLKKRILVNISSKEATAFVSKAKEAQRSFAKRKKSK